MSKGGDTQQSTTSIDPDVKAAYLTNLDYARNVANQMGTKQFADFNPQYTSGERQIQAAAQGGAGMQNLDTAADLSRAAAGYAPMSVYGSSAGPAALAGATGYNAAQFGGATAGPAALANASQFGGVTAGPAAQAQAAMANMSNINQYLNPYTQEVIDASMADLEKARQRAAQQIGQQATAAKAFGGSRQGVAEALSNAEYGTTAGKTIAQLRQQGFDTAANLMQQDVARQQQANLANQAAANQMSQFNVGNLQQAGLSNQAALNQMALANQAARNQMAQFNVGNLQQAGLSNQAALNAAGQFGAGAANQAALTNAAAMNQMAQYNASNQQAANLANQQAGLQGAQFRLGAANQLGTLGQQQTAQQYAAGQALMGLGTARQQQAQAQLDAARNLGLERLGIMQSALGLQPGNIGQTQTSPVYSNTGSSILGGAMAGYSMFGPMGAVGGGLLGLL